MFTLRRDSQGIFMYTGSQSEIVQVYLCTVAQFRSQKVQVYLCKLHMFTVRDSPGIFMHTQLHRFTVRDSPGIFMYTAAQVHSQR